MSRSTAIILGLVSWLIAVLLLVILGYAQAARAVVLAWDPSAGATGYELHYGPASGAYDTTLDTGATTQASVSGLTPGVTYYFAATAYDATRDSGFSNEVAYLVPGLPGDTIPPEVTLTSPPAGPVPRRALVELAATATDAVGVVQVQLTIGGALHCTVTAPPYQCGWQVPAANRRTYALQAVARDAAGNAGVSPVVEVIAE
jgi:Bacterial Ig domain/Fibronectin type III domain